MKHLVTFLVTFLVTLSAFAQDGCLPMRNVDSSGLPYQAGERLMFTIHYKWGSINADVCKASMVLDQTVLNGEAVFNARLIGRTDKFYDMFFKVKEDFRSWFTVDGLRPRKFIRDTHEGGYFAYDVYRYDWNQKVIHAALNNKKRGERQIEIPLSACSYDLPALIYYARNMDFSKIKDGGKYPLSFAIDDDVFTITLTYLGKENKRIRGIGTIRCLKFRCGVVAGEVFDSDDEDAVMWFTDDDNRIPVLFQAPVFHGFAIGRLYA